MHVSHSSCHPSVDGLTLLLQCGAIKMLVLPLMQRSAFRTFFNVHIKHMPAC